MAESFLRPYRIPKDTR
jgi:hypothetical protein